MRDFGITYTLRGIDILGNTYPGKPNDELDDEDEDGEEAY